MSREGPWPARPLQGAMVTAQVAPGGLARGDAAQLANDTRRKTEDTPAPAQVTSAPVTGGALVVAGHGGGEATSNRATDGGWGSGGGTEPQGWGGARGGGGAGGGVGGSGGGGGFPEWRRTMPVDALAPNYLDYFVRERERKFYKSAGILPY